MKAAGAVTLCAALISSAACNALDKLISVKQSAPFATISMNAQTAGAGFVTAPGAFFYRAVGNTTVDFTTVSTPDNTCHLRSPNAGGSLVVVDTLPIAASPISGGAFVAMQLSGRSDTLFAPGSQTVGYHMPLAASHPFTPGDTVTFTIPGSADGFPAASVSLKTAEAFTMPALRFAASGVDLPVTWTPASSPGSVINFTITYAVGPTTTQIYCQFVDDGQASVPAGFFNQFPDVAEGALIRGVDAIRMRTALVQFSSGAIINVVSVFEQPTP